MAKEIGEILEGRSKPAEMPEANPEKVEAPSEPKPEREKKPEAKQELKSDPKPAKAPDPEPDEPVTKEVDPVKRAAGFEGAYKSEKTKRKEREAEAERWKAEAEKYRKEAEERDTFWRKRMETLQPQRPPEPPKPRASLFENPEQWEQETQAETQSAIRSIQFQYSEEFARLKYGSEFDDAAKAAQAAFEQQPNHPLIRILRESQNPGEDLVQWHRKETVYQKTGGNLEEFRKKTLEEMLADPKTREELISKLGLKPTEGQEQERPKTPAPQELPTNLAGARSVSGRAGPAWTGPKPLSEIIPSGNRKH